MAINPRMTNTAVQLQVKSALFVKVILAHLYSESNMVSTSFQFSINNNEHNVLQVVVVGCHAYVADCG